MLRSGLTLVFAVLALTFSGAARAAVTVFQNPANTPTAAAPVTIVAGGAPVTMNVFYQTGNTASAGCPGVPPTCNRCLSGAGDEVCGWDIHISATNPSITLVSFTPDAGSDIVWAISGNVLRANGGVPTTGELGVHRIGSLVVSAAPAGTGSVTVVGNRYASSALVAELVTAGTTLGTVGTAPDFDLDGIPDATDNCPTVPNGPAQAAVTNVGNQTDGTIAWTAGQVLESTLPTGPTGGGSPGVGDGVGDACDSCPRARNPRVVPALFATEALFFTANPWATLTGGQRDDDHDGFGNKCDGDFTATGTLTGTLDLDQWRAGNGKARSSQTACGAAPTTGQRCARYDMDESGTLIGTGDLTAWTAENGTTAGPKCPTCPLVCTSGATVTCTTPP